MMRMFSNTESYLMQDLMDFGQKQQNYIKESKFRYKMDFFFLTVYNMTKSNWTCFPNHI